MHLVDPVAEGVMVTPLFLVEDLRTITHEATDQYRNEGAQGLWSAGLIELLSIKTVSGVIDMRRWE